jgi:hypothetical protein
MNTPHTHVWYGVCQMIRPVWIQRSHEDDATGLFTEASDLTCVTCGFVLATLYVAKPVRMGAHSREHQRTAEAAAPLRHASGNAKRSCQASARERSAEGAHRCIDEEAMRSPGG